MSGSWSVKREEVRETLREEVSPRSVSSAVTIINTLCTGTFFNDETY